MRIDYQTAVGRALYPITAQKNVLDHLDEEYGSGRNILDLEDDPAGSGAIVQFDQTITDSEAFLASQTTGESSLAAMDSHLTFATTLIRDIRTQLLSMGSGALQRKDLDTISQQIKSGLDTLVRIANTQDEKGHYLFAGFQIHTTPFQQTGTLYQYQGDQGTRYLNIGQNVAVPVTITGGDAFCGIKTGNGTFEAMSSNTNQGVLALSPSRSEDPTKWLTNASSQGYRIVFAVDESGGEKNRTYTYDVIDNNKKVSIFTNAAPIAQGPLPRSWLEGESINIADAASTSTDLGIAIKTSGGLPKTGDSFDIIASKDTNTFEIVNRFLQNVKNTVDTPQGRAYIVDALGSTLQGVDKALTRITQASARVGQSRQTIATMQKATKDTELEQRTARSKVADFEYITGTSQLMYQHTIFEAISKSFVRISEAVLFKFL